MIKKIFRKILNIFNLEIKKRNNYINEFYFKSISKQKKIVIVDVGLHKGETLLRFNKLFQNNNIIFHCFEPLKNNAQAALENIKKLKHKVFINQYGLGASKTKKIFYENIKSNTSSFHKLNTTSNWLKKRAKEFNVKTEDFVVQKHILEINSLDNYIIEKKIKKIDILKIDTQGFEFEVLLGSKKNLKNKLFKFIEFEIIFSNTYDRKISLHKIDKYLNNYGYELHAISNGGSLNEVSFEIDMLYKIKS